MECDADEYLVDGECADCGDNCVTCTDADTCTICGEGYGAVDGECGECDDDNCIMCNAADTCFWCNVGYGAVDGECAECSDENCS